MKRRLDPRALAVGLVLAAWAGMLWFLWGSGRWALHVSERIAWIIPAGAVLLTVAAAGRLLHLRTEERRTVRARDVLGLVLVALPVVVVLAQPPTTLGSFAASRRPDVARAQNVDAGDLEGRGISQIDVASAPYAPEIMRALVKRAGEEVTFVGFVTREDFAAADEFTLNRFVVTCCVDDALNAGVQVVDPPAGEWQEGEWLRVTGRIYPVGREVILDADRIDHIEPPDRPYLTP